MKTTIEREIKFYAGFTCVDYVIDNPANKERRISLVSLYDNSGLKGVPRYHICSQGKSLYYGNSPYHAVATLFQELGQLPF